MARGYTGFISFGRFFCVNFVLAIYLIRIFCNIHISLPFHDRPRSWLLVIFNFCLSIRHLSVVLSAPGGADVIGSRHSFSKDFDAVYPAGVFRLSVIIFY